MLYYTSIKILLKLYVLIKNPLIARHCSRDRKLNTEGNSPRGGSMALYTLRSFPLPALPSPAWHLHDQKMPFRLIFVKIL